MWLGRPSKICTMGPAGGIQMIPYFGSPVFRLLPINLAGSPFWVIAYNRRINKVASWIAWPFFCYRQSAPDYFSYGAGSLRGSRGLLTRGPKEGNLGRFGSREAVEGHPQVLQATGFFLWSWGTNYVCSDLLGRHWNKGMPLITSHYLLMLTLEAGWSRLSLPFNQTSNLVERCLVLIPRKLNNSCLAAE